MRRKLLLWLDHPRRNIWLTYRKAIENTQSFWCDPVWERLEPNAKPIALLQNGKLVDDKATIRLDL